MDAFCEQVVKRKSGAKQKILSGMLVAFFALLESLTIALYVVAPQVFWILFTFIIAVVAVLILTIALPKINKVEYDYSVVGNIFYADKVIDRKKRKSFVRVEINTIEDMGIINKKTDNIPRTKYAKVRDCSTGVLEGSHYCVYHEAGKGKCLLIFSPNEKIVKGMRPHLVREVVMKYFYNK